jgi:transcriptional regulator with XRE-family HTH domain
VLCRDERQIGRLRLARLPVDVIVGARLAAVRTARNVSQSQLASVLGVSENRIKRYELGAQRITPAHVMKICQFFQIRVADLFPTSDPGQDPKPH